MLATSPSRKELRAHFRRFVKLCKKARGPGVRIAEAIEMTQRHCADLRAGIAEVDRFAGDGPPTVEQLRILDGARTELRFNEFALSCFQGMARVYGPNRTL